MTRFDFNSNQKEILLCIPKTSGTPETVKVSILVKKNLSLLRANLNFLHSKLSGLDTVQKYNSVVKMSRSNFLLYNFELNKKNAGCDTFNHFIISHVDIIYPILTKEVYMKKQIRKKVYHILNQLDDDRLEAESRQALKVQENIFKLEKLSSYEFADVQEDISKNVVDFIAEVSNQLQA